MQPQSEWRKVRRPFRGPVSVRLLFDLVSLAGMLTTFFGLQMLVILYPLHYYILVGVWMAPKEVFEVGKLSTMTQILLMTPSVMTKVEIALWAVRLNNRHFTNVYRRTLVMF